ncbi:MAG: peptide-methionine (S)-S-oxide reductase MsrA [Alphaproteobacteria bacterium]|nr:MAG: peptide-methionine (S)-S-oxide reductase MsrA [Alphaproteobacteria bacterium]
MFTLSERFAAKMRMPAPEEALPGRPDPIPTAERHLVTGRPLKAPVPPGHAEIFLGMGCFWGAERLFWQTPGVWLTAVGYGGGYTPNPTYEEVCTGKTGHAELVRVVWDPAALPLSGLLRLFWENHDPTQGMRQGNDIGTQYRSAIFAADEAQLAEAEASARAYGERLAAAGLGPITTEIRLAPPFYCAEAEHQQYLARHPDGYCGLRGTGVPCPGGGDR